MNQSLILPLQKSPSPQCADLTGATMAGVSSEEDELTVCATMAGQGPGATGVSSVLGYSPC